MQLYLEKVMKTLQKTLLGLTASIALISGANAMDYADGQAYVGVKAGQLQSKINGANTKNAAAYGVFAGYQLDQNWGAEAEFFGTTKADITSTSNSVTKKGKYDVKSFGLHGTYTYNFDSMPVYAKGKLGIARTTLKGNDIARTIKKSGLSYGFGLGYQATPTIAVEADFAKSSKETTVMTIGAKLKF